MQITESQDKAAGEIVVLIDQVIINKGEIHPSTVIASCARLAGSFLFRTFKLPENINISPGNVVLSNEANEKGPVLMNLAAWMLSSHGININPETFHKSKMAESNINYLDTINLLQDKAAAIMENNKLTYEQMAHSCALATGFLIKECQSQLPAESGFNTAVYNFMDGTKRFPPEFDEKQKKKKSFFKFWK